MSLRGIRQRFEWGMARFRNIRDELSAAEEHFTIGLAELEEMILAEETGEEPAPEPDPEPEPTPEPDPTPPPSGDLTLVHATGLGSDVTLPDGVTVLEDWVASRKPDHYEMRFPDGFQDGSGPGHVEMHFPAGHRVLEIEYEIELVPAAGHEWEDHPVYTKIAHFRTVPYQGTGSKFIDAFSDYKVRYLTSSYTATRRDELDGDMQRYGYWGGVLTPNTRHTVRTRLAWLRQDANVSGANWYRITWSIDGAEQGSADVPIFGGPEFAYWEIDPTWGGNSGQVKTREDRMRIYRIATWVG